MSPATHAFDLVLCNARVATANDTFAAGIGIRDGRIVQLGSRLPAGRREIASGASRSSLRW
jgi:dihydropyrimidinase